MAKRGRPPHDDVLTPREWEVLSLIRDGLSNDEIASRLGISLDGVKYHVSEILGKLGLENRHDAARWRPDDRRSWALAPLSLWRRLDFGWLGNAVACALLLLVAGAIGVLVWALVATRGNDSEKPQAIAPTPAVLRLEVSQLTIGVFTPVPPVRVSTRNTALIHELEVAIKSLPKPRPLCETRTPCIVHGCGKFFPYYQYEVAFASPEGEPVLGAALEVDGLCPRSTITPGGRRIARPNDAVWSVLGQVLGVPRCKVLNPPDAPLQQGTDC